MERLGSAMAFANLSNEMVPHGQCYVSTFGLSSVQILSMELRTKANVEVLAV